MRTWYVLPEGTDKEELRIQGLMALSSLNVVPSFNAKSVKLGMDLDTSTMRLCNGAYTSDLPK